jgi:hypothetical protein
VTRKLALIFPSIVILLGGMFLLAFRRASAQERIASISPGFFKGEDFLKMPQAQKSGFAAGLMDGIYLAPLMGAPNDDQILVSLHKCVVGMSDEQVAAIIEKHLKEHPESWHERLNIQSYDALAAVCHGK